MSIVSFQSFCRVIQESGRSQRLYLTVTDYTPFGVLGQTSEFFSLPHFASVRIVPLDDFFYYPSLYTLFEDDEMTHAVVLLIY